MTKKQIFDTTFCRRIELDSGRVLLAVPVSETKDSVIVKTMKGHYLLDKSSISKWECVPVPFKENQSDRQ